MFQPEHIVRRARPVENRSAEDAPMKLSMIDGIDRLIIDPTARSLRVRLSGIAFLSSMVPMTCFKELSRPCFETL